MIKRLFPSSNLSLSLMLSSFPLARLLIYSVFELLLQDLEGKIIVDELRQEVISTNSKAEPPQCTSLAWSADGQVMCICVSITCILLPQ